MLQLNAAIIHTIDRLYCQAKNKVDGIAALEYVQNRRHWQRHHQRTSKSLTRQRRIGNGGSIGEYTLSAQPEGAADHTGHGPTVENVAGSIGAESALKGV